ncbi:hypothetical protein Tco_0032723 [Tanacetum coccineum]
MSFPTSIYSLGNIIDEVDIEDLTIEEYLKLTQENHAPRIGVSKDKDDLEGIIDYLEPTLYDGFIDHNDEVAYKRRRNKLLGMPYTEPPPIIKEEAEITKYNLGASENPELRGNYQTGPTHDSHVGNFY